MKHLLIFLALVAFASTGFAQGVKTLKVDRAEDIAILPSTVTGSVKIPFTRFDPERVKQLPKEQDTLRGPLSTLAADTSVWVYLPSTYLASTVDSVGQLCISIGGALLDTVSFSATLQFGVNGVPDTTAATTDWLDGVSVVLGGAKLTASDGFYVSDCADYYLLAAKRGNNCFRVVVSHQKANNASAAMSLANKKELYDITLTYQIPLITH